MGKAESYHEYLTVRVPGHLPQPGTSVFDTPRILASRYPGRATSVPYATEISPRVAACEYPREVAFVDALSRSGPRRILWRQLLEEE